MKNKLNNTQDNKNNLMFLIETVKNVAIDCDERSPDLISWLKDYLTEDIATEWDNNLIKDVNVLYDKGILNQTTVDLFNEIDKRFFNASTNGSLYEESIWTLEGLKTHPFWEEQRKLAKELLTELQKIKLN